MNLLIDRMEGLFLKRVASVGIIGSGPFIMDIYYSSVTRGNCDNL